MSNNAFLDKGILLGFCFPVDAHHRKSKKYLQNDAIDFYLTDHIESIYQAKRVELIKEHRSAVLKHARFIEKNYDSEMGPMDLNDVRSRLVRRNNNASKYLHDYYEGEQFASPRDVVSDLREFVRGMQSHVADRKTEFDDMVNHWTREDDYPGLEDPLRAIIEDKEEDFWVCVDAHDLGQKTSGNTELATTDIDDLANEDRRKLIIENTAIDSVQGVAYTGS